MNAQPGGQYSHQQTAIDIEGLIKYEIQLKHKSRRRRQNAKETRAQGKTATGTCLR
jgi:hypothetical protein